MAYEKKQISLIIEDICNEEGFNLKELSDDWVYQIQTKDKKNCFILNFKFPNNDAVNSRICDDKSALSLLLEENGIPCVKHIYFERPDSPMYDDYGMFYKLNQMLEEYGEIVCKSNNGSGGHSVYLIKTQKELEMAVFKILAKNWSMAVCPKVDIKNEYRVIVENGRALLIYSKERPSVIGDGVLPISELIKGLDIPHNDRVKNLDLKYIPKQGEKVVVAWKHNLGQGSLPVLIEDKDLVYKLASFALDVAKFLKLNFASIDIIRDEKDDLKILEINSGIMMETFSRLSDEHYQIAKHIYKSAILDYLGEKRDLKPINIYEEISDKIKNEK